MYCHWSKNERIRLVMNNFHYENALEVLNCRFNLSSENCLTIDCLGRKSLNDDTDCKKELSILKWYLMDVANIRVFDEELRNTSIDKYKCVVALSEKNIVSILYIPRCPNP